VEFQGSGGVTGKGYKPCKRLQENEYAQLAGEGVLDREKGGMLKKVVAGDHGGGRSREKSWVNFCRNGEFTSIEDLEHSAKTRHGRSSRRRAGTGRGGMKKVLCGNPLRKKSLFSKVGSNGLATVP